MYFIEKQYFKMVYIFLIRFNYLQEFKLELTIHCSLQK